MPPKGTNTAALSTHSQERHLPKWVGFYLNCTKMGKIMSSLWLYMGNNMIWPGLHVSECVCIASFRVFPPLLWQWPAAAIGCGRSALIKNTYKLPTPSKKQKKNCVGNYFVAYRQKVLILVRKVLRSEYIFHPIIITGITLKGNSHKKISVACKMSMSEAYKVPRRLVEVSYDITQHLVAYRTASGTRNNSFKSVHIPDNSHG